MGRADQQPGDVVGVGLAEVTPQDVEAEVDRGEHPSGAEYLTVVDVQLLVPQIRLRECPPELIGEGPVRRHTATDENAGLTEHERTSAQGHQSSTSVCGRRYRAQSLGVLGAIGSSMPGTTTVWASVAELHGSDAASEIPGATPRVDVSPHSTSS